MSTQFVTVLMHDHNNNLGHTIGKIRAESSEEAMIKSEMWLTRKKREHKCKRYGDSCYAYVDVPNRSLKTMGLDMGAEEIDPTNIPVIPAD